jgi:surface antigen
MRLLELDDATLVAFVDGELPPDQRAAVADAIAQDSSVATRVELMRRSAVSLRRAYDSILDEPVPVRLIRAVAECGAEPYGRHLGASAWLGRLYGWFGLASWRGVAAMAAACGVALAVGAGLGAPDAGSYRMAGAAEGGEAARDAVIAQAMESGTPGQAFDYTLSDIGVSGTVSILADVAAADGTACRSFRDVVRNGASETSRFGMACRGSDGVWRSLAVPEAPAS